MVEDLIFKPRIFEFQVLSHHFFNLKSGLLKNEHLHCNYMWWIGVSHLSRSSCTFYFLRFHFLGTFTVTSNSTSGPFALGRSNIRYIARDNAGNTRSCIIEILVQGMEMIFFI